MKRLTIYTHSHDKLLLKFVKGLNISTVQSSKRRKNDYYIGVRLAWENEVHEQIIDCLAAFLQDVAVLENPVYRCSPKLREIAKDLQESPAHSREVQRLKAFLRGSRVLNLEGYIIFRMGEFRHQLDIISYRAVKMLGLMQRE